MALIKTKQEIEILKKGGVILSQTLRELRELCVPGMATSELDDIATTKLRAVGAEPSFLNYRTSPTDSAFPATVCVSINDEVVHGIPTSSKIIRDGDIVSLDIGAWYGGLCTDMATSVLVGKVDENVRLLAERTRAALEKGLSVIHSGGFVSDIGDAIDDFIQPFGYGIVRDLVGHGVGHAVHEEPPIPNYRERHSPKVRLEVGMVLAIEPMIALGDWRIVQRSDGWTIATKDGSACAHFEVTIVVTEKGYELITPWPDV